MKTESVFEAGLAGATTLTILHEFVRLIDRDAPRMDELGKHAIAKLASKAGIDVPDDDKLYLITTVSELISNGLFFSLIGKAHKENAIIRGAALGLTAGIGAITLPKKLGLDERASTRTTKTKWMTVGLYLIGGIVASLVSNKLQEREGKHNNT
jgi:hypothetical protein